MRIKPTTPTKTRLANLLRPGVFALALTLALGACSDPPAGEGNASCVDLDGDGFGEGCALGPDCSDSDPFVTTACARCLYDGITGCGCSEEGATASCGKVIDRQTNQVVCGQGVSRCEGGKWGDCEVDNNVTIVSTQSGGMRPMGLGPPGPCEGNPCDPLCKQVTDTGSGLGQPDAGVIEKDGGLTVELGEAGPGLTGGLGCTGGTLGTCGHSICEIGTALTAGCDVEAIPQQGGTHVEEVFRDEFQSNSQGWSLGTGWQIGATSASTGHQEGNPDPASDHSAGSNNGVAGVVLGGNSSNSTHDMYYLTSPTFDTSAAVGPVSLSFWRWLNTDRDHERVRVDVYNGSSWINLWLSDGPVSDSQWTNVNFDITAHKSSQNRIRFGYRRLNLSNHHTASGWNIDDVVVTATLAGSLTTYPSCVQAVCQASPSCCSSSWTTACINLIPSVCDVTCAASGGECVLCYEDAIDHDGDGASFTGGDCMDCDTAIGPGAYDFPSTGIDEDCNGIVDDGIVTCDTGLALTSADPADHARAIGLCRFTTPTEKNWGVLEARLAQANPSATPKTSQYGILTTFGNASNNPREGTSMAAYSSGTARRPGDPAYINPNGAGYNANTASAYPTGFPKNNTCPNPGSGSSAYDSSGLWLKIRTPTNAQSFKFRFRFFSSEYPEWVCTPYNDTFVALLYGQLNPWTSTHSYNVSFDSTNNPVNVNVGFFDVPGGPNIINHPDLVGTGLDGSCGGQTCGGASNWLMTSAPVQPGEEITLHFSIWDTGDHQWDSTVLIDGWEWSPSPASIETLPDQAPPPPTPVFTDGWFVRDYDAEYECGAGVEPGWGNFTWSTTTPEDSRIDFFVRTADTLAGLDSATEVPLASAKRNPPPMTEYGVAYVNDVLVDAGLPTTMRYTRIRAHFVPSSTNTSAPTLWKWQQEISCQP